MSTDINTQLAGRYALALFETVRAEERSAVLEELERFLKALEDPQIKRVFFHPRTALQRKGELIRLAQLCQVLEHFLLLTVEKSREEYLPHILKEYKELVLKAQEMTTARVVSAVPLNSATLASLQKHLEARSGKTVLLSPSVDPKVVGGLIVEMDGEVIDASVTRALKQFRRQL